MTHSRSENPTEEDPRQTAGRILRFVREKLGPASEQFLSDAGKQVSVLSRLRHGFDLEDAVLAELHRAGANDRRIADEFLAFFLSDLMRLGHRVHSEPLRRFLDTGDLVQSVVGDLWPDLSSVHFETRGRFLSYLARRLKWKATDRHRALTAGNRREDRREDLELDLLEQQGEELSPLMVAARAEDQERLVLALLRLSERDRRILTLFLKGEGPEEIADEIGLSKNAARMALNRAIRKARRPS